MPTNAQIIRNINYGKLLRGLCHLVPGPCEIATKLKKDQEANIEWVKIVDELMGCVNREQLQKCSPQDIKEKLYDVFSQHVPGTREYILRIIVCLYLTGLVDENDFPKLKTLGKCGEDYKNPNYAYVLTWIFRMYEKRESLGKMSKSMDAYMSVQNDYFGSEGKGNRIMCNFIRSECQPIKDRKLLVKKLMQIFILLV